MATRKATGKPAQVRTNPGHVPLEEIVPPQHRRKAAALLTPADRSALEAAGQQTFDGPDFSGVATEPKQDHLQMLRTMADTLRDKMRAAQDAALKAEAAANDLMRFQMETIPQAMELAGVTSFKLEDGSELLVKDDLKCSIPKEDLHRRVACFQWLRDNGHGMIIKEFYAIDVRALEDTDRAKLRQLAAQLEVDIDVKEDVHPSTLKSLIKELLEKGTVPPPAFSVHQFKKADLKAPKGQK